MGKNLEAELVRALTCLAAACDTASERDLGLSDVDTDVAIDQLNCAGRHALNALFVTRPDLADARPFEVVSALAQMTEGVDLPEDFGSIVHEAFHAFLDAMDEASSGVVVEELEWAACHLENVGYLLDPAMLRRVKDGACPEERVRLAGLEEVIELELEENRKRVLARSYTLGTRQVYS